MKIFNKKIEPTNESKDNDSSKMNKKFFEACNLLKVQREKYGISLEMLSRKTKISLLVLKAIENGNNKNLPERTYLKQMLRAIELELGLPKNKLQIILENSKKTNNRNNLKVFTPGNINVFSSWEGNLIYLIMMFTSIITLNKYQDYLSGINVLDTKPIKNTEIVIEAEKSVLRK